MRRLRRPLVAVALLVLVTALIAACGETGLARGPVALYGAPAAEELATGATIVPAGAKLTILERKDAWVRVKFGDAEGWLPQWYLGRSGDTKAAATDPRSLVVKRQANVLLAPEPSAPTITELGRGRMVRVLAEYGDFAYVRLIALSVPDVQRGWVERSALASASEATPAEGLLRPGTVIHQGAPNASDPQSLPTKQLEHTLIVRVLSRNGAWLYVISNGGWDGWVAVKDFVADPFTQ